VIALLFLGPDKLPDAAKQISKGIRDLKKQSRILQETIENDEHIGGAIRDLKSALRGDEIVARPPVKKPRVKRPEIEPDDEVVKVLGPAVPATAAAEPASPDDPVKGTDAEGDGEAAKPAITLPVMAGEADPDFRDETAPDELAALVRPAAGTIAKGTSATAEADAPPEPAKRHG